jgi:hypothetical protein
VIVGVSGNDVIRDAGGDTVGPGAPSASCSAAIAMTEKAI